MTDTESRRTGLASGLPSLPVRAGGPAAHGLGNGAGAAATLPDRLTALARMTQIGLARSGQDGFSERLLLDSEALLGRAGERLRLSADHTVVVWPVAPEVASRRCSTGWLEPTSRRSA